MILQDKINLISRKEFIVIVEVSEFSAYKFKIWKRRYEEFSRKSRHKI